MAGVPQILERFRDLYPSISRPRIFQAPGRVNLIGEHTDYNFGLVLPMAIDLNCTVVLAPSGDDSLHFYSEQFQASADWPIAEILARATRGNWSDRAAGVAWALAQKGVPLTGQSILITSTLPLGGGLSSSAALEVAMTLALGGERDRLALAQIARSAETDFAGVPCGIMDQFASVKGGANLLDCRSLEFRPVTLPPDLAIVAVNSMVKHELGDSAYKTRVAECAAAARRLGVASLRDAASANLGKLSGVELKRARHVVTENARVEAFAAAAGRGDIEAMGKLAVESHKSLRDDYEVSCPELDFLVETALGIPGVPGARLTGGGFGGSTVNLVYRNAIDAFCTILSVKYAQKWHRKPEIHVCTASAGARWIFS